MWLVVRTMCPGVGTAGVRGEGRIRAAGWDTTASRGSGTCTEGMLELLPEYDELTDEVPYCSKLRLHLIKVLARKKP